MIFEIVLPAAVAKILDGLDRPTNERLRKRLRQLAAGPVDPQFSKALAQPKGLRSARVGDWRILFTVDTALRLVNIHSIASRGQVYRRL